MAAIATVIIASIAKRVQELKEWTIGKVTGTPMLKIPAFSRFSCYASLKTVKTIPQGLLEKAVERLKNEFQPEAIYLFGSHAWGTPTDDSDLDLMVIVRDSGEKAIRRMQRAHRCLSGLGFSKDVLVPTRAQVNRYKHLRASLFHQVLAKGRKLYG
jgi:predicted nucleotidyltransferase